MEGTITYLGNEPGCPWAVEAETSTGESFRDCTKKEMWEQLELGMFYIQGQEQIPPQP